MGSASPPVTDALPEFYLPTVSETNAFTDGALRAWDLAQRWETDRSHTELTRAGATYRQALYLDTAAGTYYTTTSTLLGYPVVESYASTLPGAYLGLREDYAAGSSMPSVPSTPPKSKPASPTVPRW